MQESQKNNADAQGAGKRERLTAGQINALKALDTFLKSDLPGAFQHPSNHIDVFDLCYGMGELFESLEDFIGSRFKCDGGIFHLGEIYRDAINAKPHIADSYIYEYSQLMRLLVDIYQAKKIIRVLSSAFPQLTENIADFVDYQIEHEQD